MKELIEGRACEELQKLKMRLYLTHDELKSAKTTKKINSKKGKNMIKINAKNNKIYDSDINYEYGQTYAPIIEAIKKGLTTSVELAQATDIDKDLLSVKYRDFCRTLAKKNLIEYVKGNYLAQIVDFVNSRMKNKMPDNITNKRILSLIITPTPVYYT